MFRNKEYTFNTDLTVDQILIRLEKRTEEKKRFRFFLSRWKDLWFEGDYNNEGFELKTITKNAFVVKGTFNEGHSTRVKFNIKVSTFIKIALVIKAFFLMVLALVAFFKSGQYIIFLVFLVIMAILALIDFGVNKFYKNKVKDALVSIMKLETV